MPKQFMYGEKTVSFYIRENITGGLRYRANHCLALSANDLILPGTGKAVYATESSKLYKFYLLEGPLIFQQKNNFAKTNKTKKAI